MKVKFGKGIKKRLLSILQKAGRIEIGGMLFAQQVRPNEFCILDFSTDENSGSSVNFRRDPKIHLKFLHEFYRRTGHNYENFNYLGEWHSHPGFSILPSQEDLKTMTELVENGPQEITFAILLIVQVQFYFWLNCSATVFAKGQIPRPIEFL